MRNYLCRRECDTKMSIDLNFWKCIGDVNLDNAVIYQKACCDHEEIKELENLPTEDILKEIASAFHEWNSLAPFHYEQKAGQGSFQIAATPQVIRIDCYSMMQADMKRFSSIMSKFECPLYDPQQGIRFDKIMIFLRGEVSEYRVLVEREISRLLPHLVMETQIVDWNELVNLSKTLSCIQFNAYIHRAKTLTKVISSMKFGKFEPNRPCHCKTASLEDKKQETQLLAELLQKSIGRVVNDFLEMTYYE